MIALSFPVFATKPGGFCEEGAFLEGGHLLDDKLNSLLLFFWTSFSFGLPRLLVYRIISLCHSLLISDRLSLFGVRIPAPFLHPS